MRSELVFGALAHMSNRYQLCRLVSKGAHKLHRPKHRVQDTTNDVLVCLSHSSSVADAQIAPESPPFSAEPLAA
jgi:hypothetical protein